MENTTETLLQIRRTEQQPKPFIEILVDGKVFASGCAKISKEELLDKVTQILLQAVRNDINERDESRDVAIKEGRW